MSLLHVLVNQTAGGKWANTAINHIKLLVCINSYYPSDGGSMMLKCNCNLIILQARMPRKESLGKSRKVRTVRKGWRGEDG